MWNQSSKKNINYWNNKYENLIKIYAELLEDLNNKPRRLIASGTYARNYGSLAGPVLPSRYGASVDD